MYGRPDGSGAYILAAAMLPAEECDSARSAMAAIRRTHRRFHWRDETDSDRHKAVELVAGLPALHLVVVGVRLDKRRQERARRYCLRRLLFELNAAGVGQILLEGRSPQLNKWDIEAVDAFRTQGVIPPDRPTVTHAHPQDETLLWVPDIVAGATRAAISGDASFQLTLEPVITRFEIELN
jgi:hypothetical protein